MPSFVSLSIYSFDFYADGCSANTDDVEYLTFDDCMDNNGVWIDLDEVSKKHSIEWKWIKGHTGHFGNEKADELANAAIDEL